MRYVCQATALAVLSFVVASEVRGQTIPGLSISNYQFVSEQRWSRTQSYITYRADLVNTGLARDAVTATVTSLTPYAEVVPGQSNLRFSPVPAGGRVTSSNTFTILVDRSVTFDFKNLSWSFLAPWAVAGPNQTARIGETITLNASRSMNPSGFGTLSYRWSFLTRPFGTATKLTGADGVIATFVVDVPGEYVLMLSVSNGFGSDTATLKVSTSNSPPVANAGANATVGIGTTAVLNGAASSDVDGDPLTYSWTFLSAPLNSSAFLSGATTVSPSFVADKAGTYIVQLIVNDGKVNSAASTVQVTTANTAPVANAGVNQAVRVGAIVQLNGAGSTDVDGDPLTYRWSFNSVPAGSAAALSNWVAVNPTFTADLPGTYVVQLIVNDGAKDSTPSTVTITTNTVQAPTSNAGPNQTVKHGELVMLSGTGTDPQGLPLTYHWSMTSRPANSSAVLSSATAPRPTFTADYPGQYVLQLIINNGYLSSPASTVTITTTNTAPVAGAGPDQIVQVGATVNLDGGGSKDADGDAFTYSWSLIGKPAQSGASLSGATTRTPSFVADLAGTYVAQLIVNDGFVNSPPATVTITAGVKAITLSPSPLNIARGSFATLTVSLGTAAGPGGVEVKLASSEPSVVSVPSQVLVAQGQSSASVTVTAGVAGSTLILATATGFSPGSVTGNVTVPAITLALDASSIGLTATTNATITLSNPVPPGGLMVSLSAQPAGVVTVPASVNITSGSTGSFLVTAAGIGNATITASIPGYSSGSASVAVTNLGAIKLASNVTVGPNQTAAFGVTLVTPAPVGGVRITLTSSAPAIATVPQTVTIPQNALAPDQPVFVSGVGFGSAIITASAPGFQSDSQTVRVTAALAFNPSTLTLGAGGSGNLTLTLSAPAPAGLVINLKSDNISVATVANSVAFSANATSVTIPVTGVASGSTVIRASALPHLSEVSASVTVAVLGTIVLPTNSSVALGQSVAFPISLSSPAPAGGTTITLTSGDSNRLTIAPTTVTIGSGKTTPDVQPEITGKGPGQVSVTATAPAFGSTSVTVSVTAALSITPKSITVAAGGTQTVSISVAAPVSIPTVVTLTSDNINVVTMPASVTIPANAIGAPVTISGVAVGTTKIHATAIGLIAAEATVNVQNAGVINLPSNVSVPLGASVPFAVTLAQPATAPLTITLSSSDSAKVTISPQTLTIQTGQTAPSAQPQVSGVSVGSANISAAAQGYATATQSVMVSATVSFVPNSITISGIAKQNVTLKLSAVTPAALVINLGSDTPTVATVPASVTIPANSDSATVQVSAVALGSTVIHAGLAPGIPDAHATVTVSSAGTIGLPASTSVALGGSTPLAVTLPAAAPADIVVTLSSSDNAKVGITPATITIPQGATTPASQPQASGAGIGTANITASAPGYTSRTVPVNVTATLSFTPQNLTVSKGTSQNLTLNLSAVTPVAVNVTLGSDHTSIASVPGTATIPANALGVTVPVTGVAAGSTVIRATGPTGVTGASANITVGSDIILPAEILVGPGEQVSVPISLSKPATETVFLQLSLSDTSKAALQQSVVTIQQGQTQPGAPPKVNGVDYGTATFTASGNNFAPATATVKVGAALSFTSSSLTLAPSTTYNLGISVTPAAPASGLVVNLNSSNSAAATVPSSVTIAGGQSGVLVQLKALAIGSSSITATTNIPTVTGATLGVTVATPGVLNVPATFLVGMGESLAYPISLSSPAGPGGVTVTLDASAPLVSFVPLTCTGTPCPPVPANATHTSVFIGAGQTAPSQAPPVRGVSPGQVTVTATAQGYANVTGTMQTTASFAFSPQSISLSPGNNGNLSLVLSGAAPPPPLGLTVNLSSSNTNVVSVQQSVIAFWDGSNPTTLNIAVLAVGAGTATIRASSPGMADATATITVSGPLTINTTSLPAGFLNQNYTATVTAGGGKTPYSWSAAGLPPGLAIDAVSGVISGIPTLAGTSSVSVTVSDSTTPNKQTTSRTFSLVIPSVPVISPVSSLPGGVVGVAYSASVSASGGTPPYTWSASGLPAGLILNTSTGAITGTPTSAGTASVAVTLTDSSSPVKQTVSKTLTLTVAPALSITTTNLPDAVASSPYSAQLAATGGTTPYTWSATGLPAGLTLNAGSGAISGTPTSSGASNITITVTDSTLPTHATATSTLSITVRVGLSITTTALPVGVASAAYSAPVSAAGGLAPYTWSMTGLPAGLSFNTSTGLISGTPAAQGTSSVSITVTDSTAPTKLTATKSLSITVQPPLTITTTSLPSGAANVPYSATLSASGGNPPYTWSATGLPAGLTVNTTSGAITGTPTTGVTNTVVVTLRDSTTPTPIAKTVNLPITIAGALSITTTSLPSGVAGVVYAGAAMAATGGNSPYSWSAAGLPAGLTMNTAGLISGTPTAAGQSTVSITVTDSTNPTRLTASANLVLNISPGVSITTTALNAGTAGSAYGSSLAASGGAPPYTWSHSGLPAGLTLNTSTGAISGTPTSAATTNVSLTVTDSSTPTHSTATRSLSIAIAPALTITTTTLPGGAVGSAYSASVAGTGGNSPHLWSASGLPAGLTLNASSGAITGTPTATGTSNVTITLTDSTIPTHATASKAFSVVIVPALTITTSSLSSGVANLAYTTTALAATGGHSPYTWAESGLPAGLTLNPSTGAITGTPTTPGTSSITFTVTDSSSPTKLSATTQLSITIAPALAITTSTLPAGSMNAPYTSTLSATGGKPSYTWSATGLPAGLALSASTGVISGTPTAAATASVVMTVRDSSTPTQATATKTLSLTIGPPVPASILPTFGSGQSAAVLTQFGSQLQVSIKDASSAPVGGVAVLFTAPTSGPSLTFATGGASATIVTNTAGLATSPMMTANGVAGTYDISATVTGVPGVSLPPVLFSLSNVANGGQISVTNATVGQNLQSAISVVLPSAAGPGGVPVTVASADSSRLLVGGNGKPSVLLTVPEGSTQASVLVHALTNTGTVGVTATASGFATGTGTVTLTPSAFVLTGPNGPGGSFSTYINDQTTISVTAARLDAAGRYVEPQALRASMPANVVVNLNSTSAGSIAPSSVTFIPGDTNAQAAFKALGSGMATVTADVPAGFTLPTDARNTLNITVLDNGFNMPTGLSVGQNLQASTNVGLKGVVGSGGLLVTLTSPDPTRLLLSASPITAGSASITLTLPPNARGTPEFYVQALASSGTATFTAQAAGFGTGTATVTLTPSGIVFTNSFGGVPNPILAAASGAPVTVTVYSARLNASGAWVETQPVAGGRSATVNVTNSGTAAVGSVTPTQVTISGGYAIATTQFQPGSQGTTTLAVSVPTGFNTPALVYRSLGVTVTVSSIVLTATQLSLGKDLQVEGALVLNQPAPSGGLVVTLTSNSSQLRLSSSRTGAGLNSLAITVPAGSTIAPYFVQALGNSGTATYTAAANGYQSGTGTIDLAPSGVVLSDANGLPFVTLPNGVNEGTVIVNMAMLDPYDNTYVATQPLRGGLNLSVTLTTGNTGIATVRTPVTINGGADPTTITTVVTRVGAGSTTLTVTQPAGYVAATNTVYAFKPMPSIQVNVN